MSSHPQPPSPTTPVNRAQTFACDVARLLDDSHCEQVIVLDLRGISPVTDFFVIASGTSDRQIQSVAHEVEELAAMEEYGSPAPGAGATGGWVIADFFDVVVHLFSADLRAYYDLESLWSDARQVDWQAVTRPGQFAKMSAGRG